MKVYESEPFARVIIDRLKLSPWALAFYVFLFSWLAEFLLSRYLDDTATIPGYSFMETLVTRPDSAIRIDQMNQALLVHFSNYFEIPHRRDVLVTMSRQPDRLESLARKLLYSESERLPPSILRERVLKVARINFDQRDWDVAKKAVETLRRMNEAAVREQYVKDQMARVEAMQGNREALIRYIMEKEVAQAQFEKFIDEFTREDLGSAYKSYVKSAINEMPRGDVIANLLSSWDADTVRIYFKTPPHSLPGNALDKTIQQSLSDELKASIYTRSLPELRSRLALAQVAAATEMSKEQLAYLMYERCLIGLYYVNDWVGYFLRAFSIPIFMVLMVKYYVSVSDMFGTLFDKGVVQGRNAPFEAKAFLLDLQGYYERNDWVFFLFVVAVLVSDINAVSFYLRPRFEFLDIGRGLTPVYHFTIGNGAVLFYAIFNMLRVGVTTLLSVDRMARAIHIPVKLTNGQEIALKAKLDPFHPDGFAGLGSIGRAAFIFNLFLFLLGMTLAAFPMYGVMVRNLLLSDLWLNLLLVVCYTLVAPVLSFYPLWCAHRCMKNAKEGMLNEVASLMEQRTEKVKASLKQGGVINPSLDKELDTLRDMHTRISAMPEWPFNVGRLSFVAGSVILPILLTISSETLKSLLKI